MKPTELELKPTELELKPTELEREPTELEREPMLVLVPAEREWEPWMESGILGRDPTGPVTRGRERERERGERQVLVTVSTARPVIGGHFWFQLKAKVLSLLACDRTDGLVGTYLHHLTHFHVFEGGIQ